MDLNTQISYCLLMSNIIANLDINEKDKETLLLLLQDRDRNYIRINNNSECFSNICKYLEILKPLKIPNNELVRIGDIGDGGYVMYNSLLASGGGGIILKQFLLVFLTIRLGIWKWLREDIGF